MTLDPQMQSVISLVEKAEVPEFWTLTPDQAREEYSKRATKLAYTEEIFKVENRRIPVDRGQIDIRIYWPRAVSLGETLPALLFFHGGGFVIGDLDTHDSVCRLLSKQSDVIVVAVDYRMSPEFKFPVAVEDCFSALKWVANNAVRIGVDADRIAVGGDSAGGNLATVVAILARNNNSPQIAFQLLIYPTTAPEPETPSHFKFAEGYLLTRKTITWFYKHYLRSAADTKDFRYAPLITDDLSRMPSSLIITAGYDPLRDEAVDYAKKLIESGNDVKLTNYSGMAHGFILMGGAVDVARKAIAESAFEIKNALKI